ncbi:Hypothetical predicted protein [Xyrichtys novacula]|uniref:Uncharacterized protein n=1 Tax=Xyrichtys novacula TaxID=13765 RepID=A0AAV1FUA1_XYRNO|nr:Hypothetical predicted protein [Xyrichtys novacula]
MKSFVRSTTARPGAGPEPQGPSGQPASEPEQNRVEPPSQAALAAQSASTDQHKSPITPCWEREKKKNEQNRQRHQQSCWTIPMRGMDRRKNTEEGGQECDRKRGHFTLKLCGNKMSYSEKEKLCPS